MWSTLSSETSVEELDVAHEPMGAAWHSLGGALGWLERSSAAILVVVLPSVVHDERTVQ